MATEIVPELLLKVELQYEVAIRTELVEKVMDMTLEELRREYSELNMEWELGNGQHCDQEEELAICKLKLRDLAAIIAEEPSTCLYEQLDVCVNTIPLTLQGPRPYALPISRREIATLCSAYDKAMDCIVGWTNRCLPTEVLTISEKQMSGAKHLMKLLCHNEEFKKDYLNHTMCFRVVSNDWEQCLNELHTSTRLVTMRGRAPFYVDVREELCCVQQEFHQCVSRAGQAKCSQQSAAVLLRVAAKLVEDGLLTPHCHRVICSRTASVYEPTVALLLGIMIMYILTILGC